MLSFYVVKQNEFPNILKAQYETIYLPKILQLYQDQLKKTAFSNLIKLVLVEFYEDQLFMHEFDY